MPIGVDVMPDFTGWPEITHDPPPGYDEGVSAEVDLGTRWAIDEVGKANAVAT